MESMATESNSWNSELYQSSHAFVWKFGRDLLAMLAPKPGERILDVGCGPGQLTAETAGSGAEVVGIDLSADMVAAARSNYPHLRFEVADIAAANYESEFDGVFSNAALHWVRDQQGAIIAIARALKPGGRLVYSVCTLTRAETTAVADAFSATHPEFGPVSAETLWPHTLNANGMFIAVWRKK